MANEQRLIDEFKNEIKNEFIELCCGNDFEELTLLEIGETIDRIYEKYIAIPTVEVAHGRWDGEADGYSDGEFVYDVWYCSECNYLIDDGTDDPNMLPNYCPHCGAKMDLEE